MSRGIREKIKQNIFGIREQVGEGEETRWIEVVRVKYVLKILEVEHEKLQELSELLKNRPKIADIKTSPKNAEQPKETLLSFTSHINKREEWCEVFEKKFELLFDESIKKENNP